MRTISTLTSLCVLLAAPAFAALSINLSFDTDEIVTGTTGTFTMVGELEPYGYSSGGSSYGIMLQQGAGLNDNSDIEFSLDIASTSLSGTSSIGGEAYPLSMITLGFSRYDSMSPRDLPLREPLQLGRFWRNLGACNAQPQRHLQRVLSGRPADPIQPPERHLHG